MAAREPLPEPDLTSQARPVYRAQLVAAVAELEVVADVAAGKVVAPDVSWDWLRRYAAPRYGADPSPQLQRWMSLFGDDLEVVRRARNSVAHGEFISDGNLAAAAQIAERILHLVKDAPPRVSVRFLDGPPRQAGSWVNVKEDGTPPARLRLSDSNEVWEFAGWAEDAPDVATYRMQRRPSDQ